MLKTVQINLTDTNSDKLEALSQRTGKTRDELLNEAVEHLPDEPQSDTAFEDWRAAMENAAGIWKDRDDIPELMAQVHKEMDRIASWED